MADQDFNIKVVTTADTSGLVKTREEIQKVREAAEKARQDAGAKALFAAEDKAKGPTPSTAPAEQAGSSLTRAFTAAAGFGYIVARVINGIAEETNKVTVELDKQGEHVVDLGKKWADMARAATSTEDIAKIAASGVKEIDSLTSSINKANQAELTLGQSMVDTLVKAFKNTKDAIGPNEELQNNLVLGLALIKQEAIAVQAESIELARKNEAAFDANKAKPLADALSDISQKMYEAKNAQDALTREMLKTEGGIKEYDRLSKVLANLTQQTDLLTQADAKRQRQAEAANKAAEKELSEKRKFEASALESASPQAKRILENEEAARRARAAGDERSADLFQRSAEQFRKSASPDQQSEASQLGKLLADGNIILNQLLAVWR